MAGKAVGGAAGKVAGKAAGGAAGKAAGKAAGGAAGKAAGKGAGKTAGRAGGKGAGKAAGEAASKVAGKVAVGAVGKGTGKAAGKAANKVAGKAAGRADRKGAGKAVDKVAGKAAAKAAAKAGGAVAEPASTVAEVNEPPKRRRRLRRFAAVSGSVLVLGSGATVAVLAVNGSGAPQKPDVSHVALEYRNFAAALPWPTDGESALWAEGIGGLGMCGKQTQVPIASVAKVMTAYVVLRDHPLVGSDEGPEITVDEQAGFEAYSKDESSAPVRAGQRISERRMLELMLVPSANNVARLLARWDAGDEQAFVGKMNAVAAGLGMKQTVYTDPAGFDAATRSTAADQLKLAEVAFGGGGSVSGGSGSVVEGEAEAEADTLLELTAQRDTQVPDDSLVLPNTNSLLGMDGIVGGKTGSSTPAGGALMWAAQRNVGGQERLVLGVVLHQNAGTTPEQGLARALTVSQRLAGALG
ncbi:D-alanyl-D-alanine carboxypeptidase [Catenulispora yoronensis]|uniref:D-alanyl-D-alanine carboxypeptidase family protein n=1 Tax=Catenulispora yoronensis TaxID=450799 RepID=UPI0031E40BF5